MAKIVLDNVTGGYDLAVINDNFDKIETELNEKVLYRKNIVGEVNTLDSSLDVNGQRLYNLPAPISANDPARLADVSAALSGTPNASLVPFSPYSTIAATTVQGAIQEVLDEGFQLSQASSSTGSTLIGHNDNGNVTTVHDALAFDKKVFTVAQLNSAFTAGGTYRVKDGSYTLTSGLLCDFTTEAVFPSIGSVSKRMNIVGQSMANTILTHTLAADAITLKGKFTDQGVHSLDLLSGFTINKTSGTGQTGLLVKNKAYLEVSRIAVQGFVNGIYLDSVLTSSFRDVYSKNNTYGLRCEFIEANSFPNALVFDRLTLGSNTGAGALCARLGAGNTFTGLTCEGNGTMGDASTGGFIANLNGLNGLGCVTFNSPYFELNKGRADLFLDNVSALPMTVVINGGVFNRASNTEYTTTNIVLTSSGGGALKLILNGTTFNSSGTYVASAARPFWEVGTNCEIIDNGCVFNETTSKITGPTKSVAMGVSVNSAGSKLSGSPDISVAHSATGVYTLTRTAGFGKSSNDYAAVVSTHLSNTFSHVTRISNTQIQVGINNASSVATDAAFNIIFLELL